MEITHNLTPTCPFPSGQASLQGPHKQKAKTSLCLGSPAEEHLGTDEGSGFRQAAGASCHPAYRCYSTSQKGYGKAHCAGPTVSLAIIFL